MNWYQLTEMSPQIATMIRISSNPPASDHSSSRERRGALPETGDPDSYDRLSGLLCHSVNGPGRVERRGAGGGGATVICGTSGRGNSAKGGSEQENPSKSTGKHFRARLAQLW